MIYEWPSADGTVPIEAAQLCYMSDGLNALHCGSRSECGCLWVRRPGFGDVVLEQCAKHGQADEPRKISWPARIWRTLKKKQFR